MSASSASSSWRSRASARKAHAKARHQQQQQQQHRGDDDSSNQGGDGGGSGEKGRDSSGSSSSSAASDTVTHYTLFDGRDELVAFWCGEMSRDEKGEALSLEVDELRQALAQVAMGIHAAEPLPPGLDDKKMEELIANADVMNAARLAFIDAMYAQGKVRALGPELEAAALAKQLTDEQTSMQLVLHAIISIFERHCFVMYQRHAAMLQLTAALCFWIWSLSGWSWWLRYGCIIVFGSSVVAAAGAARLINDPSSSSTPPSRFWLRVGHGYRRFHSTLLSLFDHDSNPSFIHHHLSLFLSAALVLDLARWVALGRYFILFIIVVLVPALLVFLEERRSGMANLRSTNRSLSQLHPTVAQAARGSSGGAADSNGIRILRGVMLNLSQAIAVYFAAATWTQALFVAAFFFPNLTTLLVSSSSIALAALSMVWSAAQERVFGEGGHAARKGRNWCIWIGLLIAYVMGYINLYGWIVWVVGIALLLLFTPPTLIYLIGLICGLLSTGLLSIGLAPLARLLMKIAQVLLTRQGMYEIWLLIKSIAQALITLIKNSVAQFIKGMREGMKAKSEQQQTQQQEEREREKSQSESDPAFDPNDPSQMN